MSRLSILLSSYRKDNVIEETIRKFTLNANAIFVKPKYNSKLQLEIKKLNLQTAGITVTRFGNLNLNIESFTLKSNAKLILRSRLNSTINKIIINGFAKNNFPIYNAIGNINTKNFIINYKELKEVEAKQCYDYGLKVIEPHINLYNISNIIECNLKLYYDLYMLKLGGWTNVNISKNNINSIDSSRLRLVDDPNYELGQVWETPRKQIVWEKNINFRDNQNNIINPIYPIQPIINDYEAIEWEFDYYIDYINGRVIFDKPLNKKSKVQMAHSYKNIQIYQSHDLSWWQEFQMNSYRLDNIEFNETSTGNWSIFSQNRVQLPAIIIETYPKGTCKNWSLGSRTKEINRETFFHIYAENKLDRDNIMDIISLETDRKIWLFDINKMNKDNISIFDYQNKIINNFSYDDLVSVSKYKWKKCFMKNSIGFNINQITPTLYQAIIKKTMNIII